jgi:hypothetical protein
MLRQIKRYNKTATNIGGDGQLPLMNKKGHEQKAFNSAENIPISIMLQ